MYTRGCYINKKRVNGKPDVRFETFVPTLEDSTSSASDDSHSTDSGESTASDDSHSTASGESTALDDSHSKDLGESTASDNSPSTDSGDSTETTREPKLVLVTEVSQERSSIHYLLLLII